jgi:hypothetical protein
VPRQLVVELDLEFILARRQLGLDQLGQKCALDPVEVINILVDKLLVVPVDRRVVFIETSSRLKFPADRVSASGEHGYAPTPEP